MSGEPISHQNERKLAWLVTSVIVVTYLSLFGSNLSNPGFHYFDEYLTLDRTLSLLERNDWLSIYSNQQVTVNKPPLQYYLGALLISAGVPPELAIRVIPVVFGLFSLCLVGALVSVLVPRKPWAVPTAVVLFSSSTIFAERVRMATLDTGFVFFILLSVLAVLKAKENPRWWSVWGLACGLGALQKVPMALLLSSFLILGLSKSSHSTGKTLRAHIRERWFRVGVFLATVPLILWPSIQAYRYMGSYKHHLSRVFGRLSTGIDENTGRGFRFDLSWLEWLQSDGLCLWLFSLPILLWAAGQPAYREDIRPWLLLAPTSAILLGLTVVGGPVYPHYVLAFTPLVVVATSVFLARMSNRKLVPLSLAVLILFLNRKTLGPLPFQAAEHHNFELVSASRRFGRRLSPGETPIFFDFENQYPIVDVYAGFEFPLIRLKRGKVPTGPGRYLGLVNSKYLEAIKTKWPKLQIEKRIGRYTIFRHEVIGPPLP